MLDTLLVLVLIICFITDIKEQKIYNKVVFPALVVALLAQVVLYGLEGIKLSVFGFFIGFCILLIPYLLGGIGAGDVKLLALIGAIKGSLFAINTALYMAIIGGVIAVGIILFNRQAIQLAKGIFLWTAALAGGNKYKPEFSTTVLLKKYPYGIAIAAGAAICLIFKGAWLI